MNYLHGYQDKEQARLLEQSGILAPLIYEKIDFSGCHHILELGSGVGAQTKILLDLFPNLQITCVDIEQKQLMKAKENLREYEGRVRFECQDIHHPKFDQIFDGLFICWTLEHLANPSQVLFRIKPFLDFGAKVFITEVFNASFYFYPKLQGLLQYYEAYNSHQKELGGNPDIGIHLGNLLNTAGFQQIEIRNGGFLCDQRDGERLKNFCLYWKTLMKSAEDSLLKSDKVTPEIVLQMERDLDSLSDDENAVFFYQFAQAKAIN